MRLCMVLILVAGCGGPANMGGDGGGGNDGGGGGDGGGTGSGIFPDDNPWNTDITNAPVDPKSADYIASIGPTTGLHQDFSSISGGNYGIPYVEVPGNQPTVPITYTLYGNESDPGPFPFPLDAPIETGSDAHAIAVDRTNGFLYELYVAKRVGAGFEAASGAKWNLRSNAGRTPGWTSADAAGLPIFPGLARYPEVAAGAIKHALRFTISSSQRGYVAPASHAAGSCPINSNCPPMGLRVRLKASYDISTFQPQAKIILQALKTYGMIVADNGSNWYISGAPNAGWDDDDIRTISRVKGADFEVVQHGAITPQ